MLSIIVLGGTACDVIGINNIIIDNNINTARLKKTLLYND
jgi:hypothetical protein